MKVSVALNDTVLLEEFHNSKMITWNCNRNTVTNAPSFSAENKSIFSSQRFNEKINILQSWIMFWEIPDDQAGNTKIISIRFMVNLKRLFPQNLRCIKCRNTNHNSRKYLHDAAICFRQHPTHHKITHFHTPRIIKRPTLRNWQKTLQQMLLFKKNKIYVTIKLS